MTIGGFAAAKRLAPEFVDGVLLPAIATVGTCTTEDARAYPADVVAAYMAAGLTQQSVRRACQGADDVAARLMAKIARVRCNVAVHQLKRVVGGVALASHGQAVERFDHVVLATQANHAGALLADATPAEASVLGAFRYRALEVLMHRDASLMPARRADWSPVHAWVSAAHERPESTIWINRVQPELRVSEPIFQTVQPQRRPRDELMIASASFERPLVDAASQRAVQELQVLHAQPERRLWLCGSYAQAGVPLLESAVRSAYAVAQAIAMQSTSAHSRDAGAAA